MLRVKIGLLFLVACVGFAQTRPAAAAKDRQPPQAPASSGTPNSDTPLFRTSARLVEVDVVVKGKDTPIEGLTQADFEVKDDGKLQRIAVFAVRKAVVQRPVTLPAGVVVNRPPQSGPEPVTATVILFDWLNTPAEAISLARLEAIKMLDRTKRTETIAVYSLGQSVKVIQPFTADRAALRRAIQTAPSDVPVVGVLPVGLTGNALQEATRIAYVERSTSTSVAFQLLARHLKGLPGRKKLIWISAAMPQMLTTGHAGSQDEHTNLAEKLDEGADLLNDANTAVYAVDPRGLPSGGPGLKDENLATMNRVSSITGGTAFYNDNGLADAIERAFSDTDVTYTLGYYQPDGAQDGDYHSISVNILRTRAAAQGIRDVRYREGYSAEQRKPAITAKQREATLDAWVEEPLAATEVGIEAAGAPTPNRPGFYDVEVAVNIADLQLEQKNGRWTGSFDVAIVPDVELKPKGLRQTVAVNIKDANYQDALVHGITVVNHVKIVDATGRPLSRRLHLVVLDGASGKAGSVMIPIRPVAQAKGPIAPNKGK